MRTQKSNLSRPQSLHSLSCEAQTADVEENIIPTCQDQEVLPSIQPPFSDVAFANHALQKMICDYEFETVLDIGSGGGDHAQVFRSFGKQVTAVDVACSPYFIERAADYDFIMANYLDAEFKLPFDAIWCSHVLEHQRDVGQFLDKMHGDCREDGVVAITVPPLKHEIVGGHLSLWNAGLLLYNLVLARFDCSDASILCYGYNISIILRKKTIDEMPNLCYDKGDIDKLIRFFPTELQEPFDGDIRRRNW